MLFNSLYIRINIVEVYTSEKILINKKNLFMETEKQNIVILFRIH